MDESCVFCKIVAGAILAEKIWEDEKYLAVLDQFPVCDGQALVLPKAHKPSYVFDLTDEEVADVYVAAKKVAKLLDRTLGTKRCVQAMEGLGVNHLHIKLYPLTDQIKEGGVLKMGSRADDAKLKEVANKIREGGMK